MDLLESQSVSSFHASGAAKAAVLDFGLAHSPSFCFFLELESSNTAIPRKLVEAPAVNAYPRKRRIGAQLVRKPHATKAMNAASRASRALRAIILKGVMHVVAAWLFV